MMASDQVADYDADGWPISPEASPVDHALDYVVEGFDCETCGLWQKVEALSEDGECARCAGRRL